MLHFLGQEIQTRLTPQQANTLMPYFQALWQMFSPEVFAELGL
jgi:uracil-DNA glycosylase